MKNFLGIDETPPAIKAAKKLNSEIQRDLQMNDIPLKELPKNAKATQSKIPEATAIQTDLNIREFLGIDKSLQSIQDYLLNNTSKLTEINKSIERETKKLEEV